MVSESTDLATGADDSRDNGEHASTTFTFHQLSWADFDDLAIGEGGPEVVRRLRHAERSRRLLLLRALLDEATKAPELFGPLPPPEDAWDLLTRVEVRAPAAFDVVLAHPYVGSWAGYTIRLLRNRITGVCPLWIHVGHLHAIAAAAAIRAGLTFRAAVPLWEGEAMLPTLGLARLPTDEHHAVAEVRGDGGRVRLAHGDHRILLPAKLDEDAPGWSSVRRATATAGRHRLTVSLDDLDPYRGLHEPVPPQRISPDEAESWRQLLDDAWRLLTTHLPDRARALAAGLSAIVPSPAVPFRNPSASTGEAFGSALVARPADGASLASTLVHEFHHILLGGVLQLTPLHHDDPRERFYVPWRDDPRPLGGAIQGVYAFFGVTAFWRAVRRADDGDLARRAGFEFARWRGQTWRVLLALHDDTNLTWAGRRFLEGVADRLGPWQDELVPDELREPAEIIAADHLAGWRLRHLRPDRQGVAALAELWLAGRARPPAALPPAAPGPTPVPDGTPSRARADLIRLRVTAGDRALPAVWGAVPGATVADLAFASGRFAEATHAYHAELRSDPDRATSWVGLGLALSALGTSPAARALTHHPELVRAVHRQLRATSPTPPTPERVADWIGRSVH
jgi:HEXXH motif-containing protein